MLPAPGATPQFALQAVIEEQKVPGIDSVPGMAFGEPCPGQRPFGSLPHDLRSRLSADGPMCCVLCVTGFTTRADSTKGGKSGGQKSKVLPEAARDSFLGFIPGIPGMQTAAGLWDLP